MALVAAASGEEREQGGADGGGGPLAESGASSRGTPSLMCALGRSCVCQSPCHRAKTRVGHPSYPARAWSEGLESRGAVGCGAIPPTLRESLECHPAYPMQAIPDWPWVRDQGGPGASLEGHPTYPVRQPEGREGPVWGVALARRLPCAAAWRTRVPMTANRAACSLPPVPVKE